MTLVDTPGADPSPESEADGLAREIADVRGHGRLPSPTVSVCVGEGGSGGALALAYADRLLIPSTPCSRESAGGGGAPLRAGAGPAPAGGGPPQALPRGRAELGIVDEVIPPPEGQTATRPRHRHRPRQRGPGEREWRFDAATARWILP